MFKVITPNFSQEFQRWTDALEMANSLKPKCRSLLHDVRIYDGEDLIWVYSLSHTYPQYIGAGTYNRLVRLFIQEAMEEAEAVEDDSIPSSSS
ncbi:MULTISPECIES: hypothetical protein [unclassified Leptolyngbya]|uniref:hypothetical protein n=1 Tax=unclassified Leptolyngbya TaxID=2650499 RepID=UPI001683F309|nr:MULTISPECIES: hypothetical protein [unclassified Leptolyngbya]MBD1909958.1 hypothetical protein [Leptolyngbya sp. FACHB-8]MBD2156765.1 hypothetical protein [Leptolyngbya sp. FACHB-16]